MRRCLATQFRPARGLMSVVVDVERLPLIVLELFDALPLYPGKSNRR